MFLYSISYYSLLLDKATFNLELNVKRVISAALASLNKSDLDHKTSHKGPFF